MSSDRCDHAWFWRRRRNADRGYWECPRCGERSEWIGLDENGRALEGPPDDNLEAPRVGSWPGGAVMRLRLVHPNPPWRFGPWPTSPHGEWRWFFDLGPLRLGRLR